MAKRAKKRNNALLTVLFLVCMIIFVFSAYRLVRYYFEYKDMNETYASINDQVLEKDFEFDADAEGLLAHIPEVDFLTLKEINPEVLGYILIPNTTISYPIAQSDDPYKYLNNDVSGNASRGGAIFLDPGNDPAFQDDNTIIYGHNLMDGSMFGQLQSYISKDSDFFDTHRYIYIYLEHEVRLYRIFSAQTTEDGSEIYTINFGGHEDMLKQNQKEYEKSVHEAKALPDDYEGIITLSTCSNGREIDRTVVLAYFVDRVTD